MYCLVKLTCQRGQYRITIPKELIEKKALEAVEVMKLTEGPGGKIILEEYYGKKENGK